MISIFTPSHNAKWLDECYASLTEQTNDNWEWIVLLNGKAQWTPPEDERVKVYRAKTKTKGVGALKREAVEHCTGEYLLELDHDDKLMPTAIMDVEFAFDNNPEVGLVYSDCAQINEDGTPNEEEFSSDYGWEYYFQGGYKVAHTFDPHPHNASYIWFAPNHLRAFRRSTYERTQGYNANLTVADDAEIMVQLYIQSEFYHINECLYLQRIHKDNTQKKADLNAKIQETTVEIHYAGIEAMSLSWATRNKLMALDLGSHHGKPPGFTGVDLRPGEGVDIVEDFMALDVEPGTVGVIRAYDFMEHIADRQGFMDKCYELLCHGGMLLTMTPSTDGRGAFQDPTHISYWNSNSFWYYSQKQHSDFIDNTTRFQMSSVRNVFPTEFHREHNILYVQANLIAIKNDNRDFGGLLGI